MKPGREAALKKAASFLSRSFLLNLAPTCYSIEPAVMLHHDMAANGDKYHAEPWERFRRDRKK